MKGMLDNEKIISSERKRACRRTTVTRPRLCRAEPGVGSVRVSRRAKLRARAATPHTVNAQKIALHEVTVSSRPPSTGASMGASTIMV